MIKLLLMLCSLYIIACNQPVEKSEQQTKMPKEQSPGFFPVTNYLRGQIAGIKSKGINPLKIDSANGKTDSVWLKMEDLDSAFQEFLHPEIDSTNLANFYQEDKFADETLATYTFTYTALPNLPAQQPLKRWDVYISQETNTVKSIYMVKQFETKELQLTWQSNASSKIVSIATDNSGRQFVEYEQVIKWNFD